MNTEATAKVNYTPALEAEIVRLYDGGKGMSIEDIAVQINKPVKSVRGKLVHLKAYVKPVAPVKEYVNEGPSKKDYLGELAKIGFSEDALKGLGNATKPALAEVLDRLNRAVQAA